MPRRTLIPYFVAAVTGVVSGIYIFKPLFTGANSQNQQPPKGIPTLEINNENTQKPANEPT
ncbi:hypothetical protein M378DRAFT_155203 [Amanita muscaria Koide BX008]|uniref:Uncharacterized protein n=1 Tax=Amanita muscaria (strain Koide BX008) TaxID=946122 RepID=A0A0C2TW22_AMAMK|nr:hypothetical protein M378DRAFT_155203 [Amanita muscaria Koide BX008]